MWLIPINMQHHLHFVLRPNVQTRWVTCGDCSFLSHVVHMWGYLDLWPSNNSGALDLYQSPRTERGNTHGELWRHPQVCDSILHTRAQAAQLHTSFFLSHKSKSKKSLRNGVFGYRLWKCIRTKTQCLFESFETFLVSSVECHCLTWIGFANMFFLSVAAREKSFLQPWRKCLQVFFLQLRQCCFEDYLRGPNLNGVCVHCF